MSTVGFWKQASPSVILGVPDDFSLASELGKSKIIRIAVAFMNSAGLRRILDAIPERSQVELEILVGLDFGLTAPKALNKLLSVREEFKQADFRVILSQTGGVFHPKIMIIYGQESTFALVGSANCTSGGFDTNWECTVYIDRSETLEEIATLIDRLKYSDKDFISRPLTSKLIKDYEARWQEMRQIAKQLDELDREADEELTKIAIAQIEEWDELIKAANKFAKKEWSTMHSEYTQAVSRIRQCLNYPDFTNITYDQWLDFYDEWHLGHLIAVRRDVIFNHIGKLSEQLRQLVDDRIPVADRVDSLLEDEKIYGVGINLVTKVLTCHNPDKYPTWNNPVIDSLSRFGLKLPRGATEGQKYAAFQEIMEKMKNEAGLDDMLALDAFLYSYSKK
jgi:HKD family nuclease